MIFDIYEQSDLFQIAGCSRQVALMGWLNNNHIPFTLNAKRKVIAHKSAVDTALGVVAPTEAVLPGVTLGYATSTT